MNIKKHDDLDNLDSVSKRLKYIVDTLGVKQSHMAEKLGVSPSGLHYILNNDVKFSKNAKKIADYLNVNEEWLATGKGDIYEENTSITTYKIPVYYPDQLKLFYRSNQKSKISTHDFLLTSTAYPNRMTAIYITETHFAPKFEVGDIVAFEQAQDFQDGDIVLAYLEAANAITLKYAFHLKEDVILISLDESPIKLDAKAGDILVGSYRECLKKNHSV